MPEIGGQDRPDGRVDGRGADPLVEAPFREDGVRQRDVHLRPFRGDHLGRLRLVDRVAVGVQEAHRHRFHVLVAQPRHGFPQVVLVEGLDHPPAGVDALAHAEAQVTGHQRRWRRVLVVVEALADAPAHLEGVAEPQRGDQPGPGDPAGENGVGGHRRAVHDHLDRPVEVLTRHPQTIGEVVEAGAHVGGGVIADVRDLGGGHRPVGADAHQVGERAPNVDAHVEDVRHRPSSRMAGAPTSTSER